MAVQNVVIRIAALDKTSGALRNIGRGLSSLAKPLFSLKTALAGVIGVGGMTLLVKQSLAATDALAKTAGRIGTSTEALSALQYAGKLTGVEINTMNMALQRFTRRTAEAAVGTGEAKGALRELGVDARQLVRLPLDERMLILADAFEGVSNESDRLRLAFKLFDSEGAALVNTLSQGREGLAEMLGEARSLGVVMSSNAAKGVEDANDALFRLQSLFGGIVKQTVAALAPAISALADLMTSKVSNAFDSTNNGIQAFAKTLAVSVVNGIIASVQGFETFTNGLINTANELIKTKELLSALFGGDQSARQLEIAIERIEERLTNLREQSKQSIFQGPLGDPIDVDISNLELQLARLKELKAEAEQEGGLTLIDPVSFQNQIDTLRSVIPVIEAIDAATTATADSVETKLPSAFDAFLKNLEIARGKVDEFEVASAKLASQIEGKFTQAFTDAITGAKSFGEAMRGLAKSVVDSLIKMLVQYYITKPLFDAITGGLSSMVGGGGGAGGGGKAIGGAVQAGKPYMVGERGPELFVPNASGGIVANNQLGGGDAVVVNQTINVTTGVQQTVRAEIANLLPQISNAAKAAVADSRMRGGGFSKAMVGA